MIRASAAAKTFETPRVVPGLSVSSCKRILEPARRDACGRAVHGQQRDEVAGRARQRPRPTDHRDPVAVQIRIDRRRRITGVGEQQDRAEQVVEPAAGAADDEDPRGLERDGSVERELEIGRVLGGRVPLDDRSRRFGGREPGGRDRVEIADRTIDAEPEREPTVDACVCRDHIGAARAARARLQGRDALRQRRRRSRLPRAYLRWHYPDQVLRVGGASSHPLSPVVPELPVSLPPS